MCFSHKKKKMNAKMNIQLRKLIKKILCKFLGPLINLSLDLNFLGGLFTVDSSWSYVVAFVQMIFVLVDVCA